MKGHIRERSPGRWAIILDQHDESTGKRKRKWHSFRGTKRQAQVECTRLLDETRRGVYVEPSKTTVAEFLEQWLEYIKSQVSPRSHERYAEIARKNLAPVIGGVILAKFNLHKFLRHTQQHLRMVAGMGRAVFPRAPFTTCTAF